MPRPTSEDLAGRLQQENDGFTVNERTGYEPSSGAFSAIYGHEKTFQPATPGDVEEYRTSNSEVLSRTDHFLGGWRGDMGGPGLHDVLDVSKGHPTAAEALETGRRNGQEAVVVMEPGGMSFPSVQYGADQLPSSTSDDDRDTYRRAGRDSVRAQHDGRAAQAVGDKLSMQQMGAQIAEHEMTRTRIRGN